MTPLRCDVPGYRTLRLLGTGGMGAVFLVEPEGMPGVLRVIKVVTVTDDRRRARFVRECELLARAQVGGIVRVHAAGEHGEQLWLCMEHVPGGDLRTALGARGGSLPWEEATRLARDLARDLAAVHALGVVHRDLKPENVLLDADGRPRLADFGIASAIDLERLTLTGGTVGTPGYLAPEQVGGRELTPRCDVYALGVCLYELITGTLPIGAGMSITSAAKQILTAPPPPPSRHVSGLPPALDDLVLATLAKDPARRPDAAAFAARLDEVLAGSASHEARALLWLRRRARHVFAASGVAVVLLAAGAAWTLGRDGLAPPPVEPVAPARVAPPPPLRREPMDELGDLLVRGAPLEVLGWLKAHGPIKAPAEVARLAAIEELARSEAIARLRARGAELVAWIDIVGALREQARATAVALAPGTDLADAALARLCEGFAAPTPLDPSLVPLLERLAAAHVRPGDRTGAEAALDAAWSAWSADRLPTEAYAAALVAFVELDVDLELGHTGLPSSAIPDTPSVADDYVRLHAGLVAAKAVDDPGQAAAELLALVTGERAEHLGPVTRSRGISAALRSSAFFPRSGPRVDILKCSELSVQLDPRSPYAHMSLAVSASMGGRGVERAEREARVVREVELALECFARGGYAERASVSADVHLQLLRSAVNSLMRFGRTAEVQAIIDEVRAGPNAPWADTLEQLRASPPRNAAGW